MQVLLLLALVGSSLAESVTWGNSWNGGAQSAFHVSPSSQLHGWRVKCTFDSAIDKFEVWTAEVVSQTSTEVVVQNKAFDADVAAGGDLKVDFLIRGSFTTPPGANCALEGTDSGPTSAPVGGVTDSGSGTVTGTGTETGTGGGPITSAPASGTGGSSMKYDYKEALKLSILFFDAQRSGQLPSNNPIPWRGDSAVNDGDNGHDLSGGWYDAGDNVKFNLPMAYSTWVLAWGFLRFKDGYAAAGQTNMMCDMIKWPLDYFLKCWVPDQQTLYVQVGDGGADHAFWGRPENMHMGRPAFKITAGCPGSDVSGDTAAALAAGSLVFKNICNNAGFADTLLGAAKSLYAFGKAHTGIYSNCVTQAKNFYGSTSWKDEMATAATFLYEATKDSQYLTDAKGYHHNGLSWALSWDDTNIAANLRLYEITQEDSYKKDALDFVKSYDEGGSVPHTPCGLAYRDMWGPNRYAANAAFVATIAAADGIEPDLCKKFAMSQINYILGDNKNKISYEIGFGSHYPQHPHHRGSSCPTNSNWCDINSGGPNPNILKGAIVGGPDNGDNYQDTRTDYVHNEVACDYNAGFQGALAGLVDFASKSDLPAAPQAKC